MIPETFRLKKPIPIGEALSDTHIDLTSIKVLLIEGIAAFRNSTANHLSFCDRQPTDDPDVAKGSIILCPSSLQAYLQEHFPEAITVVCPDPRAVFINITQQLASQGQVEVNSTIPRPFGVHRKARIANSASVHPETLIDADVSIGENCVIHRGTWIHSGSVIHDNAVVGVEGITLYRSADKQNRKFPHLAGVVIGQDVEIGANTVISRGILNDTVIGPGTIVGNLCNIGHVAQIGENVWMSVGCLIGGHTQIGDRATIGMGVAVRDNLVIGEGAQVGMGSVVIRSISSETSAFGNPARAVPSIQAGPVR